MTFWADNIKFIKDISDAKYKKIEHAVGEVGTFSPTRRGLCYK
jgi:hypothetical protein